MSTHVKINRSRVGEFVIGELEHASDVPGGRDELTFYIMQTSEYTRGDDLTDRAGEDTLDFIEELSWQLAAKLAQAQTRPVRYVSRTGRVTDYGVVFSADAFERVIWDRYRVNREIARADDPELPRALDFETWVVGFRADAELDNPLSDINQMCDPAMLRDYPRYVAAR